MFEEIPVSNNVFSHGIKVDASGDKEIFKSNNLPSPALSCGVSPEGSNVVLKSVNEEASKEESSLNLYAWDYLHKSLLNMTLPSIVKI